MTEKLLSTKRMRLNCKNTKNGCREVLADFALEDHESECFYREIPVFTARKIIFKDYVEDVVPRYPEVQHPISRNQILFLKDNDKYSHRLRFQFAMKTFIFVQSFTKEKLVVIAKLYIVGSPEEAKHFSCTLKYFGLKSSVTFDGQVMSVDDSVQFAGRENMDGKFFVMNYRYFERMFVNKDGKYEYSLEVKNLKEEAKDDNYESGISDDDQETKK